MHGNVFPFYLFKLSSSTDKKHCVRISWCTFRLSQGHTGDVISSAQWELLSGFNQGAQFILQSVQGYAQHYTGRKVKLCVQHRIAQALGNSGYLCDSLIPGCLMDFWVRITTQGSCGQGPKRAVACCGVGLSFLPHSMNLLLKDFVYSKPWDVVLNFGLF